MPTAEQTAALADQLRSALGPDRVSTRALDRHALAHDASHFLLVPRLVARPRSTLEVAALLRACGRAAAPVTFRSGGTSLSGQAVTEHVLADTRRHFQDRIEVLDDGARVRVDPGVTVRRVNATLAPYRTKIGPDPASEGACTIGGVVANNSSGMHCGTAMNSYATLDSLVVVLPGGTVLDTGAADADARLRDREPDLYAGLLRLRDRVRGDADSVATIRRLFALKNTMGYGLNSFLDHDDPVPLLTHLMVGSEGTLGFIASATFRTVPVHPHVATGLLVFDTVGAAAGAVPELVAAGAVTAELLDAASLRASAPVTDVAVVDHAALLVEWHADSAEELTARVGPAEQVLAGLPLAAPAALTREAGQRAALWAVRKGLYSVVAWARPAGTNALLEDVAVAPELLGQTCVDLTGLFERHGYADPVIFGHARDGNVHFMLTERFSDPVALRRYAAFTEDLVDLVLARGGTLKAEHGTGRTMAPFVRRQYGAELHEVMWELKRLVDPGGLLNPGSVLGDDPQAHLRHLKVEPEVEDEVDRCVECGFCEPVCPSRNLTVTPRQRIVLRRELRAAQQRGDEDLAAELAADGDYDVVQTCAVDGMCLTACPVGINTGDLVRRLRAQDSGPVERAGWALAARGWGAASRAGGLGLSLTSRLPGALPEAASDLARRLAGTDTVPRYDRRLPGGGPARPELAADRADAVLFGACVGSMFGPEDDSAGATAALVTLAGRAGLTLRTPDGLAGLCCGTPWKSKGMTQGWETMRDRVLPALLAATDGGRLPVVCDAASCTEGLRTMVGARVEVVDAVTWVAETVLDRVPATSQLGRVVVHPTCGTQALGATDALRRCAEHVATEVVVPRDWGCCGFAGDRGLLHPELTASATAPEAAEVLTAGPFDAYVSANRTCEIGLTRATGKPYQHVLELVERGTRH